MDQISAAESLELWASKIQSDWAGPALVPQLNKERVQGLAQMFREGKLDNMVKVRILLACLFLSPVQQEAMRPELCALAAAARDSEDEWVKVTGVAVGNFDGQLDTAALVEGSVHVPLVRDTLELLWTGLDVAEPPKDYRPMQEVYMHPEVLPQAALDARRPPSTGGAPPHNHFTPRPHEDATRFAMAPPSLEQLLSGDAWLRVDQGKGGFRKTPAPVSKPAALTFRDRQQVAATAGLHPTTGPHHHGAGAASADAPGPSPHHPLHSMNRAPSLGAMIGARSSKMKSLELQESIQLSTQAAHKLSKVQPGPRSHTSTAHGHPGIVSPDSQGPSTTQPTGNQQEDAMEHEYVDPGLGAAHQGVQQGQQGGGVAQPAEPIEQDDLQTGEGGGAAGRVGEKRRRAESGELEAGQDDEDMDAGGDANQYAEGVDAVEDI